MRSLAVQRYSAAGAITLLTAGALQAFNLSLELPFQQLKLAWTLTRVLLQL